MATVSGKWRVCRGICKMAKSEPTLHDTLLKHGYTHLGRSSYAHPDGHFATAGENGKSWMHNHTSTGNSMPKTGWGHEALDEHLTKLHSSQHSELEPGHVSPEHAREIVAEHLR